MSMNLSAHRRIVDGCPWGIPPNRERFSGWFTSYKKQAMQRIQSPVLTTEDKQDIYALAYQKCLRAYDDKPIPPRAECIGRYPYLTPKAEAYRWRAVIGKAIDHIRSFTNNPAGTPISEENDEPSLDEYLGAKGIVATGRESDPVGTVMAKMIWEAILNDKIPGLTAGEKDVLLLRSQGYTNAEIARQLGIVEQAVDHRRKRAYLKYEAWMENRSKDER